MKLLKAIFVLELVAYQKTTCHGSSTGITENWSLIVHLCRRLIICGTVSRVQIKNTFIAHFLMGFNILKWPVAGTMLQISVRICLAN